MHGAKMMEHFIKSKWSREDKMTKTKTQARWKDVLQGHFKEGKEKEKQQQ